METEFLRRKAGIQSQHTPRKAKFFVKRISEKVY